MADDNASGRRRTSATLEKRFWAKVNKNGPIVRDELGPCWVWTAATSTSGYGVIGRCAQKDGLIRAHRYSYELHVGPIPDGNFICHRCDNRKCVRPEHLFAGTHTENMADMVGKLRGCHGEKSITAKLSSGDVLEIMSMRGSARATDVAKRFGVSDTLISKIWRGLRWAHLRPSNDNGAPHE